MISFESDYIAGAHPKVLEKLIETNLEAMSGYGSDPYTKSACEKIKAACECEEAEVFLLTGGTQTNALVISSMLADYEGVVAADTGHVGCHEAGAIEYTGHKVLPLPNHNGKVDAQDLKKYLSDFYADANHEHMVFPGMLYISHPTEYGTLYSKQELTQLSQVCREYGIPLYLDGARLSYGLMSRQTDVTLPDIARLCDVFYIGGTKAGALCGEAVVFTKKNAPKYFMTIVKQHGALLAKGRLLGVQFDALFTDDLYFEIGRHAIEMAEKLKAVLSDAGCIFYLDSPTNQQFIVLEDSKLRELEKEVAYSFWEKADETHTVIRLATGWSTQEEDIESLRRLLWN
ncbi:MAG: aminotransferase class I/II-fold pyridoxal phosphate-dependent enzyme [Lachnospiraceae bacterium]|nr:aminotransferase class I/II-fold pyridoxal phosphate-dependent enzyme [Lachnospiraceae bacterium]